MFMLREVHDTSTIRIIIANDIETNPGPNFFNENIVDKRNMFVCTYNLQGCGNFKKLKRVTSLLNKLPFKNNCIINLQETHWTDKKSLGYHWKSGHVQSNGTSTSCGVAILYNDSYFDEIIDTYSDTEGRFCSLLASKDGEIYYFANVYAPNCHYLALSFFERVKNIVNDITSKYPNANLIISGDYNVVLDPNVDSIGRLQSKQEKKVVNKIEHLIRIENLFDTYRHIHTYGGFTWGKDNPAYLRSRLDVIFASKILANKLVASCTTYSLAESDHCFLFSEFIISELKYGPGIIRANADLLEDPEVKDRILDQIKKSHDEIKNNMDPHLVLDHHKYTLRNLLLEEGRKKRKHEQSVYEHAKYEVDILKQELDKVLIDQSVTRNHELERRINSLKEAITIAEEPLQELRNMESKRLIFRSKAKWAEEGEKSTKYFLNLLQNRQKKMQIRKIISNGKSYYEQDEISKAIMNFYRDLYSKQPDLKKVNQEDPLFQNLPTLNTEERKDLEKPITLDELKATLGTCKDSAPGPDGISYDVYKHTWEVSGPIILNAWNHSDKIGYTSTTQREAVITLLEKKGKDKSNIANLRPISLSNCDIKICTKTLALRTNKILHKLLCNTQTGYVPGRQITNNNRLIEEVINLINKSDEEAYLITLDAQKAFDSVDHDYLVKILEVYNFPPAYIRWVKTIYNRLEASVMVNGYTTIKFKIEQSVKQGDALSCALFVLAIEPLLVKIQGNSNIKGIIVESINPQDNGQQKVEIKKAGFADDITCLTSNINSLQEIIDEYEEFLSYSGVKLNIAKTEILIIGKKGNQRVNFNLHQKGKIITITDQEIVKICGISFSNDAGLAYEQNIKARIDKLQRQLNIWKQRNLTLEGKILIVKTFGLSQLTYALQSTYIKKEDLKAVDMMITKFIWNLKSDSVIPRGKIRKDIFQNSVCNGGLNAPNIYIVDRCIKYKALLSSYVLNHPIKVLYDKYLNEVGFDYANYSCNLVEENFLGIAISTHLLKGKQIKTDINELAGSMDGIHKNYYSYIQNKSLVKNDFVNVRQQNTLTRLQIHNLFKFQDLVQERTRRNHPNIALDVHQIFHTFPNEWRTLINNTRRSHPKVCGEFYLKTNCWMPRQKISLKLLVNSFVQIKSVEVNAYLNVKHNEIVVKNLLQNPFLSIRRSCKDVKIRNLQYKMLHNIYPTMSHLFKWKIKESENCNRCNIKETLKHAIFDCPIATQARDYLETVIAEKYCLDRANVQLTFENVLFGLESTVNNLDIRRYQISAIDTVIVSVKQILILQRENKCNITLDQITKIFEEREGIEKYNTKVYRKKVKGVNRWGISTSVS